MTTESWSSRVRDDSDATYQEWRDEFITKLGLMVTAGDLAADETNITAGAGAKPGLNTEQGYAVYHLDDSLHATAPIYLRFGFGTGNNVSSARIQVTVGTETNGSGVLGGIASTTASFMSTTGGAMTSDVARQSYLCVTEGFFGINWKVGAGADGAFFICRSCDADGAITATGAIAHWGISNTVNITKRQSFRYAAVAAAYTAQTGIEGGSLGINPQAQGATAVDGDVQAMMGWMITPRVQPIFGVCGVISSELVPGGTFSTTLVGATPRTYLTMSAPSGPFGPVNASLTGGLCIAMLWE